MIKAVLWDCFDVLYVLPSGLGDTYIRNQELLGYSQRLRPTHKVALLTNLGLGRIQEVFSSDEQHQFFDAVIVSSIVGMNKPDPEIYLYTCERLGVEPARAVMVDNLDINCVGARRAGLQAIAYQSNRQIMHDLDHLLADGVE